MTIEKDRQGLMHRVNALYNSGRITQDVVNAFQKVMRYLTTPSLIKDYSLRIKGLEDKGMEYEYEGGYITFMASGLGWVYRGKYPNGAYGMIAAVGITPADIEHKIDVIHARPPAEPDPPGPHQLTIHVQDDVTRNPVAHADVDVAGQSDTTNSSGTVYFQGVMRGDYDVFISKSGYYDYAGINVDQLLMRNRDKSYTIDIIPKSGSPGPSPPPTTVTYGKLRVILKNSRTNQLLPGIPINCRQSQVNYEQTKYTDVRGEVLFSGLDTSYVAAYILNPGSGFSCEGNKHHSAGIFAPPYDTTVKRHSIYCTGAAPPVPEPEPPELPEPEPDEPAWECANGNLRCKPTNSNVLQKCINNRWVDHLTCPHGCEPVWPNSARCKLEPTPEPEPPEEEPSEEEPWHPPLAWPATWVSYIDQWKQWRLNEGLAAIDPQVEADLSTDTAPMVWGTWYNQVPPQSLADRGIDILDMFFGPMARFWLNKEVTGEDAWRPQDPDDETWALFDTFTMAFAGGPIGEGFNAVLTFAWKKLGLARLTGLLGTHMSKLMSKWYAMGNHGRANFFAKIDWGDIAGAKKILDDTLPDGINKVLGDIAERVGQSVKHTSPAGKKELLTRLHGDSGAMNRLHKALLENRWDDAVVASQDLMTRLKSLAHSRAIVDYAPVSSIEYSYDGIKVATEALEYVNKAYADKLIDLTTAKAAKEDIVWRMWEFSKKAVEYSDAIATRAARDTLDHVKGQWFQNYMSRMKAKGYTDDAINKMLTDATTDIQRREAIRTMIRLMREKFAADPVKAIKEIVIGLSVYYFGTTLFFYWAIKEGMLDSFGFICFIASKMDDKTTLRTILPAYKLAIGASKPLLTLVGWMNPLLKPIAEATWEGNRQGYDLYARMAGVEFYDPVAPYIPPEQIDGMIINVVDGDSFKGSIEMIGAPDIDGKYPDDSAKWITGKGEPTKGYIPVDVRAAGINTPDQNGTYWVGRIPNGAEERKDVRKEDKNAADSFATTTLKRRKATFLLDHSNLYDAHNRLIAVIVVSGENYNIEILKRGLGVVYFYEPHKQVSTTAYLAAEKEAENNQRGLWSPTIPAGPEICRYVHDVGVANLTMVHVFSLYYYAEGMIEAGDREKARAIPIPNVSVTTPSMTDVFAVYYYSEGMIEAGNRETTKSVGMGCVA